MTDLRGERVDEGKVWAACPRCRGGAMDLIETWRLAESVRQGVERLADENAALCARVNLKEEVVEGLRAEIKRLRTCPICGSEDHNFCTKDVDGLRDRIKRLEEELKEVTHKWQQAINSRR